MLRTIAILFGIGFLLAGILCFVPVTAPNQMLLGIFFINFLHSIFYIITGIISFCVGLRGVYSSQMFFRIFGLIYAILAVWGFVNGPLPLMGIVANNMADAFLHLVIAIVFLYLGFAFKVTKSKRKS